ncbi:hypothetical protein HMI54_000764 [Coelomomyces lativittatus]|nr:hypothetical protein HMI54_000764 [Coelomomyces lativittatus]KAJ1516438.1 hypothetical protein HMI55_002255 [Coelomomyces lativittatus]
MRMYQLNEDEGTQYLKFPDIPDISFFKTMYRQRINNLGEDFSIEQKKEIVEEAILAIQLRYDFMIESERLIEKDLLPVKEAPVLISLKSKQNETPPPTPPPVSPKVLVAPSKASASLSSSTSPLNSSAFSFLFSLPSPYVYSMFFIVLISYVYYRSDSMS